MRGRVGTSDGPLRFARRGDSLDACWRFGSLQTLDGYTSTLRRGGVTPAAQVFTEEPPSTRAVQIDAAFAALADHLAERDAWQTPAWANDPARRTPARYPAVPVIFRKRADEESPRAFAVPGIRIHGRSLARARTRAAPESATATHYNVTEPRQAALGPVVCTLEPYAVGDSRDFV